MKMNDPGRSAKVARSVAPRWHTRKAGFSGLLHQDLEARAYLKVKLRHAAVGRIVLERPADHARFTIYSARPGVVIGKNNEHIDAMKSALSKIMGVPVNVNIEEIRKPEIDSQLIADSIARQLEKQIMLRRAMKRAMHNAMRLGAMGIKIMSAARLGGTDIVRKEWCHEGRIPLHALRGDIDYGASEATTASGTVGVKVWVYKGAQSPRSRWPDRPDAVAGPAKRPADPALVTAKVTEASADVADNLMRALPDWITHQQATSVMRLHLTLGGDVSPGTLLEFLARESPAPFDVRPIAPLTGFDSLKAYSVIGRFASGAVRTIGHLQPDAAGGGAVTAFGYWSLIDPDNAQLDPDATTLIESTIDFVAVEVM